MRFSYRHLFVLLFAAAVIVPAFYLSGFQIRWPETGSRNLSSSTMVSSMIPVPRDLAAATGKFYEFLGSNKFTDQNCGPILSEIYERMYKIDAAHFDREKAISDSDTILRNLWESKILLRKRLGGFLENGRLSRACVDASRNILRAGRYMEDYVGYLRLGSPKEPGKNDKLREAYTGGYPHLMVNADMPSGFKSGDILMSRGTAFTSAAIARIGDIDAQFSHLAILYIDENTGKKYTVEAHIEIGVKTFTLDEYLKDGKARAVLYRYPDAALAHRAAKLMFEEANRASATGENINYDFGMVMDEPSELFCSEVVQRAFQLAAKEMGREFRLPLFPTSMNPRNRDFLTLLGIKVNSTFAPADMEIDPRVEIIAEWRDYDRVRMLHRHDAALVKVFDWMERHDYVLVGDLFTWIKKKVIWSMRRWPLFSNLLKEKFPKNMSSDTLGMMFKLNTISTELFEALEKADNENIKKGGLPMTPKNMEALLDKFREKDLETYRFYRDCQRDRGGEGSGNSMCATADLPKFHWDFRARKED
jgi:hypothetical protein